MHSLQIAVHTDRGPRENLEDAYFALSLSLPLLSVHEEATVLAMNDGGGVRDVELFTMLAMLGVVGVALCLVIRVLRPRDEDEDT